MLEGFFISLGVLSCVIYIYDRIANATEIEPNTYQVWPGYFSYFMVGLILLALISIGIGVGEAYLNDKKMLLVLVPVLLLLLRMLFYSVQYTRKYKILFNDDKIQKTDAFSRIVEIKIEKLTSASYSFYGFGSTIVLRSNDNKKIKINPLLTGFKDLKKFLEERDFLIKKW